MNAVIHRVRAFIRQHALASPSTRVVAAVSGGSDSMALVHILADLEQTGDLRLAGIAHFNHQLRADADRDERFVREAAAALGRPFVSDGEDVAARAARERCSIEKAARAARHAFFERARRELAADVVALGHSRDDQAETILLRLLRGAGPRGLAGMYPRNGAVVRPLLDTGRDELRRLLAGLGVAFVEDSSNADVSIPRNRVRAELIPLLAGRFNPRIVEVLADEAALERELWDWMNDASAAFLATPGELDVAALRAAPPALARLVVWRAMGTASGGRHISFNHVGDLIRLIHSDSAEASLDLPGHHAQRIGGRIVLTSSDAGARRATSANFFSRPLSIPGTASIPEAGCTVTAEDATRMGEREGIDRRATVGTGPVAVVRRDLIQESLVVRNRRPGDRFRPIGVGGSKKLQDLFVDRKVARRDRDSVPVVVDGHGRIVWVAGYGIDEAFQVTDPSQAVLVLRLTRS